MSIIDAFCQHPLPLPSPPAERIISFRYSSAYLPAFRPMTAIHRRRRRRRPFSRSSGYRLLASFWPGSCEILCGTCGLRFSSFDSVRDKISVVLGGLDICSSGAFASICWKCLLFAKRRIIPITILFVLMDYGNKLIEIVLENNQSLDETNNSDSFVPRLFLRLYW